MRQAGTAASARGPAIDSHRLSARRELREEPCGLVGRKRTAEEITLGFIAAERLQARIVVEVRVGQQVNVGDHVAVIEAMKMKTDVFTKVAGTVTSVLVKVGDSIGTDEAIISIG